MAEQTTGQSKQGKPPDSPESAAPTRTVICEVFRSPRREGMYLYVERGEGLARVPEILLARFGTPESALVFRLHEERRLARLSAPDVLRALVERGFYLQMPPVPGAGSEVGATDARPDKAPDAQRVTSKAPADREEPSC